MEELKNNKLFWVVVAFGIFNLVALVGGKIIIDKAADRVIEKLQKDYSPSPYGPGLDPDKIDPESLKKQQTYFENRTYFKPDVQPVVWRNEWEQDRGFNLEQ